MKTIILGFLAVSGVWAAAQGQTEPRTPSVSANGPSATAATDSAVRSSFQTRLQNTVNAANGFTRLAAMENRSGAVITRRSTVVGYVSGWSPINGGTISVTCVALTNTRTNQTEYGITILVCEGSNSADSRRAYVDYEDINPLLEGIDSVSRMELSAAPFNNVTAAYTTRGGLRIQMDPKNRPKFGVSLQAGGESIAEVRLTPDKLAQFRGLLDSARTTLNSARESKQP